MPEPESRVVAFVPDLMDRSRLGGVPGVRFVAAAADLPAADADIFVVDLARPGALDVLPLLRDRRVVAFGSHVDRELLDAARAAGCETVLARSTFFASVGELLA